MPGSRIDSMPDKRWFVQRTNPEYIKYLSESASITPAFAQVLINRGINKRDAVKSFLDPSPERLSDPCSLHGIKEASEIIRAAIGDGQRILVHGDYDADGLTATAVMVSALERLGADVRYFIPDRMKHGYGFNSPGVEYAGETGAALVVTVDCGITSFEAVKLAASQGIGVVITDHHEPASNGADKPLLPEALVIVNPKLYEGDDTIISGSFIAFKLASSLLGNEDSRDLMDLAAIGTVADVVPLIRENRILVREGLKLINEGRRPGINALRKLSTYNGRPVNASLLSFAINPRLNAAGRVSNAADAIRLLLSRDDEEAAELAARLNELNLKRQEIQTGVYQEALSRAREEGFDRSIVLASEKWHEGIIGIVASKLAGLFFRPAFIFSIKDGIARGSARSIPPFDLHSGLSECRDILISFGGHKQAAGVKLQVENLPEFEKRMNHLMKDALTDKDLIPILTVDAGVELRDVNFRLVKELALLEPLGFGNPEPVFGTKGLEVMGPRIVGKNHLKMRIRDRSVVLDAIGFNMGGMMEKLEVSTTVDAVYTPAINEWKGGRSLQVQLMDFRPSIA